MSYKGICNNLESSDRSLSMRSTNEKQGLKHLDNQASDHLSLAEEQALLLKILEEFKDIAVTKT